MASKWAQVLGDATCPYMTRWVLDLRLFSLRLHHFHRSDDDRHLHDHPWWFLSLILSGGYEEITERGTVAVKPGRVVFRRASHRHAVKLLGPSCWTIVLTGPIRRVWGFWVKGLFHDSRRYFGIFGHPPCKD